MNRRKLLSTAPAAIVLAGNDTAAAQPDAKLIALCAEFETLEHKYIASLAKNNEEQDRADAVAEAINREQALIVTAITGYRPTTLAGFTALVNSAVMADPELIDGPPTRGDHSNRLVRVLVRGMLGRESA